MSFSLGHLANATYASPLCYVPFDINQPYSVPNVMAINALSEIRKGNKLERLRNAARHGLIKGESGASSGYYLYFSSFFMDSADIPSYFQYDTFDMSRQEFMGRPWSDIDAVKEFKRPETAKSAKDGRAPSIPFGRSITKIKSISETSSEKGATTPDFVFRVSRDDIENVCASNSAILSITPARKAFSRPSGISSLPLTCSSADWDLQLSIGASVD
ncbi:hypothetical protein I315_06900 [Cryptococcus gattii Ru294]|nr:hypothetical protein I315_06900 [Cryptococcus gattii Ru294]